MILNGKVINPGELRTRVTVQSRTVSTETIYAPVTYTALATVWCRWTNVHGQEVWTANMAQAVEPATVLMRYLAGVDATCMLLKGGVQYEVVSVDDISDRHEYLELKVKRLGGA